jgi:O-antigen/teichoic acid export membrane protein
MLRRLLARLKSTDEDLHEVIRGSAVALAVKLVAGAAGLLMAVAVSRQLGADESGLFFLIFTVVTVLAALSRGGLDNVLVRFIAAFQAQSDRPAINALYRRVLQWSGLTALAIAAALWLVADAVARQVFHKPELAPVIGVMAWGILPTALYMLHARALQGLKDISRAMFLMSAACPLFVAILAFVGRSTDAIGVAWAFLAATLLCLALGRYWWLRIPGSEVPRGAVDTATILHSSNPLFVVLVFSLTANWSSQILLGSMATSSDVAIFNAAQRAAMLTSLVFIAVNSISAPKFAAMHKLNRLDALRRTARQSTRLMAGLAAPVLLFMLLFPETTLSLFGSEFRTGAVALQILVVGQYINVATGSVAQLLTMTGHERLLRNNVAVAALIALILNLVLIPWNALIGAAVATSVAVAAQNLLSYWHVRRLFGRSAI